MWGCGWVWGWCVHCDRLIDAAIALPSLGTMLCKRRTIRDEKGSAHKSKEVKRTQKMGNPAGAKARTENNATSWGRTLLTC